MEQGHLATLSLSLPTRNANPWSLFCSRLQDYCENGKKNLIKVRLWRPRCFVTFKSLESSWMFFLTLLLLYHTPLGITLLLWFLKCFIILHGSALLCVCVCTYSHIHIRYICYMYTHIVTYICILCMYELSHTFIYYICTCKFVYTYILTYISMYI